MKCNQAQSLMLDHLYGGLRPRKEKALLLHLRECPNCAKEYETHKATASAFAKLDMEEPPPGLTARLVAMAAEDIERQKSVRIAARGWNWMPAMATAAVAVFAVVFVIRYIPEKHSQMASAPMVRSKEEAKQAPMPKMPAKRGLNTLSQSEISTVLPMADAEPPSDEYRLNAKVTAERGFYGLERDGLDRNGLGDDIAMDNLAVGKPDSTVASARNRASGLVGGKAFVDGPPESEWRLQTPEPQAKQPLRALGHGESGSFGRRDFKDSSGRLHADKEASEKLSDSSSVAARYSYADQAKSSWLVEGASVAVQMEAPAAAKPEGAASEPEEMKAVVKSLKKEKSRVVGGTIADVGAGRELRIANGERKGESKFDLDAAQEEQASVDTVFDAREFNEAVAEYENVRAHREPYRQFTAEAKYKLGKTYQEEDDCEKALAIYETIPDDNPDFDGLADVYIAMGECYLKLDRFDDALQSFELVREKFPDKSELAARKSSEIVAAQKALKKANEDAAESEE